MPARARARRADWAPGPGVLVPVPGRESLGPCCGFGRGLRGHTTSGPDLDVEGSDAELLAAGSNVLGSQHGGVGRRLVTVGLDLHATSDTADGLTATGITRVSLNHSLSNFSLQLHSQRCAVHVYTYVRSVTWTKVSLNEAKIRATPKTSSPITELAINFAISRDTANWRMRSYPHGPGGPGRCSPGRAWWCAWEEPFCWYVAVSDGDEEGKQRGLS